VHSARAGDAELGTELEKLLASHEKAGSFLQAGVAPVALPPGRIGPYELLREIGHGGMGTVYLAARADDEYRQTVALKLIRRGMDTDLVVSRFRNERQILASLHHPNIASLLDGGTTPAGVPYLVMEHVDGEPIDRYCDARRLPIRERLELFLRVCGAVQHAHASLVVHRDLKPGNILVNAEGQPKLLDFGLAKLLDPALGGVDQTATQQRFLTPSYASPEQIQGNPITTASDVYSLGVLLYLLLTGHRPYGSESSSAQEIARAVCEAEPTRPSAAALRGSEAEARASARSATPRGLRRRLNGDLDAILLKALRKEPERRFASVERLAADLRRHLEGRPVSARAGTTWYLASRFVATHRAGVLATALVVVSLAWGLVETSRQRARAERRFGEVRELANSFIFEIHDAIENLPGSTKARELLIERARKHLDGLAREAGGDRALQLELAAAYEKLGDVLGRYAVSNLGRTPEAVDSYRKALAIRETLVAESKGAAQERLDLARNHSRLGESLTRNGDLPGALERQRRSLAIREALAREEPGNVEAQSALSVSYFEIGSTLQSLGDRSGALSNLRNALAIREKLVETHPDRVGFKRGLGNNYGLIGEVLLSGGDLAGAADAFRRSLSIFEAALNREPAHTATHLAVQTAWLDLGVVEAQQGNVQAALQNYRNALDICEKLTAADPANIEPQRALALVLSHIGDALASAGSAAEALASQRRALAVAEGYAGRDSADPLSRLELARYQRAVALALARAGDRPASLEGLRKALATAETLAAKNPASAEFRVAVALGQLDLGQANAALASAPSPAVQSLARWRQARASFQKSLESWTDLKRSGLLQQSDACRIEEAARGVAVADKALGRFSH